MFEVSNHRNPVDEGVKMAHMMKIEKIVLFHLIMATQTSNFYL